MEPLPPLVSPATAPADGGRRAGGPPHGLDAGAVRWSRSVRLPGFGLDGQERLAGARVLVVGAGGLGAPVVHYLAAAGVGTLGIVDDDVVDESNLQRQVLYRASDVGRPKARVAAEVARALSPDARVVAHPVRLDASTAAILDDYDLVVDGSDSFDTCYLVADAAAERGLPVVWGSVARYDGQVSVFWDAAPDGRGVDHRDLHPAAPADGWDESCADVGVLGPLCGLVGSVMASEAVKLLTGVGESLLGRVVTVDAAGATWRESRLRRAPHRVARRSAAGVGTAVPPAAGGSASGGVAGAPDARRAIGVVTASALRARLAERDLAAGAAGAGRVGAGPDGAGDAPDEPDAPDAPGPSGPFVLLDVREPDEHDFAHIPGDVVAPGYGTRTRQRPELDPAVPVVVYCARGPRAQAAARLLADDGHDVSVLEGGMLGWTLAEQAGWGAGVGGPR